MFVVSCLVLLMVATMAIPKEGAKIFGMNIKFLPFEQVLKQKEREVKNIADIVEQVDTTIMEMDTTEVVDEDAFVPGQINYEINNATTVSFSKAGLAQLHIFFQKLNEISTNKKKLRIVHYGDSQIEGDRMTGFIRQRIQSQFGGTGPGMISALNVYNTNAFKQELSENFMRFTCFGGEELENKQYGLLNTAARFTAEKVDSTDLTVKEAWITIAPSTNTYANARQYRKVRMFYNSCVRPCVLNVYENDVLLRSDSLKMDSLPHVYELKFEKTPGKLKFEFKARVSPTITGFSLEGNSGVQVDNVAMRGSSGTFLRKVDKNLFARQLQQENVDLIFWQYGGNSMPYLEDSTKVENYASYYKSQLNTLKRLNPDMAIVAIGPSDMSTLIDGYQETYPMLPYAVELLKKSALEVGVGYWDLYEAMGGRNSMPAWVEKGLAGSDYIHFSNKGAKIASQLFYDAFIAEYAKYMKK